MTKTELKSAALKSITDGERSLSFDRERNAYLKAIAYALLASLDEPVSGDLGPL